MKRLTFIPEFLIWLIFTVVAGFGYAFSFFEYISNREQLSIMDIIMPTLVWILIAAICAFLLGMAQNTQCFVQFSKGESIFLESSILALLLIGGWVFRFTEYFQGVWPVGPDNEFFQYAQVSREAITYMNPHPASRLYVGFLHVVCLFLGNIYEAGAFVQFLLLLAAVLVWYFAIRKVFGPVTSLFFAAGAMLLPDSIVSSMECNPLMLLFVIYGIIALIMAFYAHSKCSGIPAFICEFFIGVLITAAILMDISGWLFVIIGGLALRGHRKICAKKSFVTPIAACLGLVVGEKAFTLLQAEIYGMSYKDAGKFLGYPNLTIKIPDLHRIQEFVFTLGTHPIFIVSIVAITIYWLLNEKNAFTQIMLGVLFLFGVKLFGLDTYMPHDFFIYMGIVVLFGLSVQRYLQYAGKHSTGKNEAWGAGRSEISETEAKVVQAFEQKEEPVVTVIRFEDEPAVTVPEKEETASEEPLIFIPKTMEIPKRVPKPKVDYTIDVSEDKLYFDYPVEDNEDFDIK